MSATVGHLFAGIDGFGLGLEGAGFETRWTVELADFPNRIIAKRRPRVERFRDVRDVDEPPLVTGLAGGFPCQDLSPLGKRSGISGDRSGLWGEYARIARALEPRFVLIENVRDLLKRGMEVVVRDLVEAGYVVEWDCLPAAAFGAHHLRDRLWIVAHRAGRPAVYGEPLGLFAHEWVELPVTPDGWLRWPRAGFVCGGELTELEPLAPLGAIRKGARFPTPVARDWKGAGFDDQLGTMAARGLWPTPRASSGKSSNGGGEGGTYRRTPSQQAGTHGLYLQTEVIEAEVAAGRIADDDAERIAKGKLNPEWVEWLMGFPLGWTNPDLPNGELRVVSWDEGEPRGLHRVTPVDWHRQERLTALGNTLVPPAAEWLGHRIANRLALNTENTPTKGPT